MKKTLSIILAAVMVFSTAACGASESGNTEGEQLAKEVPTINLSWGNEMHTGIMYLPFIAPELFENESVRINPLSEDMGELQVDGQTIANIKRIVTKGGSECATMMGQESLDIALTSSTAMMTAYDVDAGVSILSPIQCDGVAITAKVDAPYNTFLEFVEYAKNAEQPVKAGYHSAISSPRVVLESAMKDAGLNVTEDPSDFKADVLMVDLKGVQNLVPSLSSGQVEMWAGPAPHPQNAEENGVGKIISTLNELPEGKWADFPCCCYAARNIIIEEHPEVIEALGQVITYTADYANNNQEATGEMLAEIVGVEKDILPKSMIVYGTDPNETFINGINIYYDAMKEMGKFSGKLIENDFETAKETFFNFDIMEKVNKQ
ncbi:ABC transporter substrate-binding protein [Proteocatella sphenisci]|uniref:ABC transporter substrate-binding protein n=1 Tax=Proteocatella sphenisci TaxID=181070 RepID=UPI0004B0C15E|nr:ABC transporter substrate-binding protein [Proteocatella sphenisci]